MREFYVIRLGRPQDANKSLATGPNPGVVEDLVGGFAAPARNRRNEIPQQAAPTVPQRQQGFGYYVKPADNTDKSGSIAHTTLEAAEKYAGELAGKTPGVMYGVFTCVKVFETTTPTIITKKFNDSGELVLDLPDQIEEVVV